MARRIKDTSFEHISKLVNNDIGLDAHADLELNMANAYIEDVHNATHADEVAEELEKKAEDIITEHEEPEAPIKNDFTAPIKLDESFEDFKLEDYNDEYEDDDEDISYTLYGEVDDQHELIFDKYVRFGVMADKGEVTQAQYQDFLTQVKSLLIRTNEEIEKISKECVKGLSEDVEPIVEARSKVTDDDDDGDLDPYDKHLDMDMLDFLNIAFTGVFPKVLNPLGSADIPTFKLQSNTVGKSDIDDEVLAGMSDEEVDEYLAKQNRADRPPMIGGDYKSIDLYANNRDRLITVMEICDAWKLNHSDIISQNRKTTTYPFRVTIEVPLRDGTNALGVEEYFRTVYPEEADYVMYKLFHSASPTFFPRTYYSKKFNLMLDDMIDDARSKAYNDNTKPFTYYLDELYKQLDELYAPVAYGGAKKGYSKKKIQDDFLQPYIDETVGYAIEDVTDDMDPKEALNDLYDTLDKEVGANAYSRNKVKKQFQDAFPSASLK